MVLQKGTANMDSNLSIAYKARHTLAMSLDIDSREMKDLHSHKNLHTDIYSVCIHSCHKLETI